MVKLVQSAGETVSASSTPADPKLSALFSEIALIAGAVDAILVEAIDAGADSQRAGWLMDGARRLALQVGWLADLSCKRSGEVTAPMRGGAEDWLLPPNCLLSAEQEGAAQ